MLHRVLAVSEDQQETIVSLQQAIKKLTQEKQEQTEKYERKMGILEKELATVVEAMEILTYKFISGTNK